MAYKQGPHLYAEGREAIARRSASGLPYWLFDAEVFDWRNVDNPNPHAPLWRPSETFSAGSAETINTRDLYRVLDTPDARTFFDLEDL